MKLPGLTIPEIEEIPANQREDFLRRCDETAEIRQFRSRAQFLMRASVLCAAAVPILLGEFVFHWHSIVSIGIGIVLTFAALFRVFLFQLCVANFGLFGGL